MQLSSLFFRKAKFTKIQMNIFCYVVSKKRKGRWKTTALLLMLICQHKRTVPLCLQMIPKNVRPQMVCPQMVLIYWNLFFTGGSHSQLIKRILYFSNASSAAYAPPPIVPSAFLYLHSTYFPICGALGYSSPI